MKDVSASKESEQLERLARIVIAYLVILTVLVLAAELYLLVQVKTQSLSELWTIITLCSAAGMLGSTVAALRSAMDRRANGWEFNDGTTYPDQEKKERFNTRIAPSFFARPFLGLAIGYVVYLGILGGVFSLGAQVDQPHIERLAFWSFLGGLFAKTLLDKLNELFKQLVGK